MADVTQSGGARPLSDMQATYMAQVSKRRLYSGITLLVFILLMVSGFRLAEERNGGSFIGGLDNFFDYPGEVVAEAVEKAGQLPGHFVTFFPALLETVNIAAVSTLIGALAAVVLSLLSTRGMARFPRLVPVFRRIMDITRAVPEIVIALILIFVLGGGPVPAMIAIAFHTSGALGKLFSEVNENASLKPLDGLESVGATWSQRMMLGSCRRSRRTG